jgi:Tol biopolymer transport system component
MRLLAAAVAALALAGGVQASGPADVQDRDAVPSPDGSLIAYTSFVGTSKRGKLIVMRRDGTHSRTLGSVRDGLPWWSPDGKLVAYVDRDIYVISPTGGRAHRLTHEYTRSGGPAEGLSISGWDDSRTIAYEVYDCCIVGGVSYWWDATVTLGGKQVDHEPDDASICAIFGTCESPRSIPPAVSPGGSRVVTSTPQRPTRLTLSGAGLEPVDLGIGSSPVWAPDGGHLAWYGPDETWSVADRDGGDRHSLPSAPSWSSDGSSIAFAAAVGAVSQVWLAKGNGADARAVTDEPSDVRLALAPWSGDGRWVAYSIISVHKVSTVAISADGTQRHVLHHWSAPYRSEYYYDPAWSSLRWEPGRGSAVYYDTSACGGTAIFRVDAATTRARRLTDPCAPRR